MEGGALFQRRPDAPSTDTKGDCQVKNKVGEEQREGQSPEQNKDKPIPSEQLPDAALPYSQVSRIKILGMLFDQRFSFEDHMSKILAKARTRLAILNKVAGSSWGLETGMLRLTGKSLVLSLLRYGQTVVGSSLSEKWMSLIDTRIINILARKIVGAGPSARLSVLRAIAGVESSHNMYIQQCAKMLNLILRADRSSVQAKMEGWLGGACSVVSWAPRMEVLEIPEGTEPQIGRLRYLDYQVAENWCFQVLENRPCLRGDLKVRSVYHSSAQEIRSKPNLRSLTYDYIGATSWMEVGVQIADASGWRPDCSASFNAIGVPSMPPSTPPTALPLFHVEPYGPMGLLKESGKSDQGQTSWKERVGCSVHIVVGAFFQDGLGVSAAWVRDTNKVPCTQMWALGEDRVSNTPPAFALESSILHALLIAEKKAESLGEKLDSIQITEGNWRTCRVLANWFLTGELELLWVARTEIIKVFHRLAEKLRCPMNVAKIPEGFFEQVGMHSEAAADTIVTAVRRFFRFAVPRAKQNWGGKVS